MEQKGEKKPAPAGLEEISADPSGGEAAARGKEAETLSEDLHAQRMAERLKIRYVDLRDFQIDADLFRSIPVDLMFRYNFIPWKTENGRLVVVISDPSNVLMMDELELLLGRPIVPTVGSPSAIQEILK